MRDEDEQAPRRRAGRPRDASRDRVILDAALDVLADAGYDRTTIDVVAARAGAARATVYRRWPTKLDLVLDAVRLLAPDPADLAEPPDTGSLRGDCLALVQPDDDAAARRRIRVVGGLQAAAAAEPRLSAVLETGGLDPWIEANRVVIQRAVDRGEIGPVDVDALAQVLPLMCTARAAVQRLPITAEYSRALIDGVLLPAVRGASPAVRPDD